MCLALWLAAPLVQGGVPPQDAIAILVAGSLADDDAEALYDASGEDLYDLPPAVRARTCDFYDDRDRCLEEGVAFISPPFALPVLAGLASLPDDVGILLIRLSGAVVMALGFVALARRTGAPADAITFPVAAIALLPAVSRLTELGQTSGLLFLLACLPVHRLRRPGEEAAIASVLVAAVAMKGFPAVLLIPLVLARRWRLVGMTLGMLGALGALATVVSGPGVWSGFVDQSRSVADSSLENPYNLAMSSVLEALGVPAPSVMSVLLALTVTAVFVVALRRSGLEIWWVAALPVSFLFLPQVWNHYLPVLVPLVVVASLGAVRDPDRWMAAAALVTLPLSLWTSPGWGLRSGLLLVFAAIGVAMWLLARRPIRPPAAPSPVGGRPQAGAA